MITTSLNSGLLRLILVGLAGLLSSFATAEDPEPAPPSIRALTANVRYGTAGDGAHAWPLRRELTLNTLEAARPDVLGLQEALLFQLDAVRARFPHHLVIGEGRDGGDRGEWTALLVDGRRFTVRAAGTSRSDSATSRRTCGEGSAISRRA